jgi:hypothetical protein
MSHGPGTPLNAIIGSSETMRDGLLGPIDPQYRYYVGNAPNTWMAG